MDKVILEQRVTQLKSELEKTVAAIEHSVSMRNYLQGRLQEAMDWLQTFVQKELDLTPTPETPPPAPSEPETTQGIPGAIPGV